MKVRLKGALALAMAWVLLASGCQDDDCNPDYHADPEACSTCVTPPSDCSSAIPTASPLSIHLSRPLPQWVRIYAGKAYETGTLVQTVVPASADFSVSLPLERNFLNAAASLSARPSKATGIILSGIYGDIKEDLFLVNHLCGLNDSFGSISQLVRETEALV